MTRQQPHEGIIASVTQEYAGLGGTSDFYKITGKAKCLLHGERRCGHHRVDLRLLLVTWCKTSAIP